MKAGRCNTDALLHRDNIGSFHNKTDTTPCILEQKLKRVTNNGPTHLPPLDRSHEGTSLYNLTTANHEFSSRAPAPSRLHANTPIQAAILLLHAASIFKLEQFQQPVHLFNHGPGRGGTSLATSDHPDAGLIPENQRVDWKDIDPIQLPFTLAAAAPLPVLEPSPFELITNFLQDGFAVANGDHHIHADALAISRQPTNKLRRHQIKSELTKNGISVEKQRFSSKQKSGSTVRGMNLIVNLSGPVADTPGKHVILMAHVDKTGEGSAGFYDNAVSCAALVDMAKHFKNNLPAGARLQIVFVDAEEQGLVGSKALANSLLKNNTKPDLIINIDLMGGSGKEVYVGASNSSNNAWFHADDFQQAKESKTTPAAETKFIELLNEHPAGFNFVQNEGTPTGDHLAFQYKGIPAIGLSVVKTGESEQMARFAEAYSAWGNADLDWRSAYEKIMKLTKGTDEYNAFAPEAKAVRQRLTDAKAAFDEAFAAATVYQRLHNSNDQESLFHSGNTNQFATIIKNAVGKFFG